MTEPGHSQAGSGGRRRKRFLSPSEKYEIWIGLLRGEYSTVQAAERAGVDRTTIMRVRQVAKQGALVFGAMVYHESQSEGATASAVAASLGCGVPTAVADLHPGETVLDLGSGAGADVLISAQRIGATGLRDRPGHDR
jgi:hypothetical protein